MKLFPNGHATHPHWQMAADMVLAQLRASAGGTLDLELERGVELRLVCLLADRQPFEGARLSVGVHAPLESTIGRTTTRYLER